MYGFWDFAGFSENGVFWRGVSPQIMRCWWLILVKSAA